MRNHSTMSSVDEPDQRVAPQPPVALCFHKVTGRLTFGSTNYSPRRFERLIDHLQRSGFSLSNKPAGERPRQILLTFDDGYAHLADTLPLLMERFSFHPLIFVPTAWISRANKWDYSHLMRSERHLNAVEIRQLSAVGVRFGAHGHRHVDLTGLSDSRLKEEYRQSKATLEDILGAEVTDVSYPFGRVDERVAGTAAESGFREGYTMDFPEPDDHPLRRGRYAMYFYDTRGSISRKLRGGFGRRLESARAGLTNRLSYGTILLNRIRRVDDDKK